MTQSAAYCVRSLTRSSREYLQICDCSMSLSRPEAGSRDFPDTEVPYNTEIEDTGDSVKQSMNLSLPDAGFNPVVPSLHD